MGREARVHSTYGWQMIGRDEDEEEEKGGPSQESDGDKGDDSSGISDITTSAL